jgi:hypothetical protein
MARRLTLAAVLLFAALPLAVLPTAATAEAQVGGVVWVGTYPQVFADGCVHYVAAWSDGTFTATPRLCPPGVAPIRGDTRAAVVDSYAQESLNSPGCIEFVTRWADGVFTWVPYFCPFGLLYFKPGTIPVAPPVLVVPAAPVIVAPPFGQPFGPGARFIAPGFPPGPPGPTPLYPPGFPPGPAAFPFYQAGGTTWEPNCGLTQIKGWITNRFGGALAGVTVRVWAAGWDGVYSAPSRGDGYYDVVLDVRGRDATWNVAVVQRETGQQLSPVVVVQTNSGDCGPTGGGHQVATVRFQQS